MLRIAKTFGWLAALALGLETALGFVVIGPFNEAWQVRDNGFNIAERGDLGGPKNIGEEYRRNVPILYYSYDANFLGFFGSNGVAAVDQAFAILNSLTNVSAYSPDLSEVPLSTRRFNFTAATFNLLDLKSIALEAMMEQLGLADPIRYVWDIHDRSAGANCPLGNQYLVVMRNLGVVPSALDQVQYTNYINGVLYTYYIHEYCQNPPFGSGLSEAIAIPLDTLNNATLFIPVAAHELNNLGLGAFFTGLTRDDVAGLRYLLQQGNINWEDSPANTIVFATNSAPANLQLLVTSNLTLLAAQALTNNAAALQALYPGLVVTSTTNIFTAVWVTNFTAYFTNLPWTPALSPPTLAFVTNRTLTAQTHFHHTFGNIEAVKLTPNGWVVVPITDLSAFLGHGILTYQTIAATNAPWTPVPGAGTNGTVLVTNIFTRSFVSNEVVGEFFVLPTNLCDVQIVSPLLTNVVPNTNLLVLATATNLVISNAFFAQTLIDYFTNHTFVINPVFCLTNEPGLRRGVEKLTFRRRDFDSLLGRLFIPVTNNFTMVTVSNNANLVQTFQRVVTAPDFVFSAVDLVVGPAAAPRYFDFSRNVNFNQANVLPGLAGPGTIDSPTTISFNKAGPVLFNIATNISGNNFFFLDQLTAGFQNLWASFDDSTNPPVLYPSGISLQNLESQMLLQIASTTLTNATVGKSYSTQLTGTGGQPPYTWTLAANSPGLPPGLTLASDGSGSITGTPTTEGVYDFVVQMTDINGRFALWEVTLTVVSP